jgi:hypothetical protein
MTERIVFSVIFSQWFLFKNLNQNSTSIKNCGCCFYKRLLALNFD